ncbi:DUF5652 family protein [Microbacterium sp. X-17]|uniref:DUF5652 family protein n=1 Tax=Microbacterium sp. X-17 TaxID=3144404 RepID=UPI0031F502D0
MRALKEAPHGMHRMPRSTGPLVVAALAWSLAWKGASLWRAAKNDSKPWFVTLLLTNTLGLLDAAYLFGFGRRSGRGHLEAEQVGHAQDS